MDAAHPSLRSLSDWRGDHDQGQCGIGLVFDVRVVSGELPFYRLCERSQPVAASRALR